jgi:adenylate kinase
MGPPGAGKGTQGELLAQSLGIARHSTGDILRDALCGGTPLGIQAQRYMDAGELVPDDVILGIVGEALDRPESRNGFLLDGFPRTVAQAEGLARILSDRDLELDAIVDLAVPDEEIINRLSARGRSDDSLETIRRRLEVYRAETRPVLDWYASSAVDVLSVEGVGDIGHIHRHIMDRLGL